MGDLKKGARITGKTRDKLAADLKRKYEKGASIRALAEATGRSYGFVRRVLSESGVTLRGTRDSSSGRGTDRGSDRQSLQRPREDAHKLVDALPDDRVPGVVALLRQTLGGSTAQAEPRRFRTVGIFDGDSDLGRRSKGIARQELGGK